LGFGLWLIVKNCNGLVGLLWFFFVCLWGNRFLLLYLSIIEIKNTTAFYLSVMGQIKKTDNAEYFS